jgi:transposase InsO family protein
MINFIFKQTNIKLNVYSGQTNTLTDQEKLEIVKEYHDNLLGGHQGITRTVKRIRENYNWKGLKSEVKNYIKHCDTCQKDKMNRKIKQPMEITTTASGPFQKLFLDLVGPLPKTLQSNNYILTLLDDLTKYSIAVSIVDATANTVARAFVQNFVCIYGVPDTILTDQETNFMSNIFKHICKILNIKKLHTTAYHPQSNGALERSHSTLKNYIRSFDDKDQTNWDEYIIYLHIIQLYTQPQFLHHTN